MPGTVDKKAKPHEAPASGDVGRQGSPRTRNRTGKACSLLGRCKGAGTEFFLYFTV